MRRKYLPVSPTDQCILFQWKVFIEHLCLQLSDTGQITASVLHLQKELDEMIAYPFRQWQSMILSLLKYEKRWNSHDFHFQFCYFWNFSRTPPSLWNASEAALEETTAHYSLTVVARGKTMAGVWVPSTGTQLGFSNDIHILSKLLCILCSGDICYG